MHAEPKTILLVAVLVVGFEALRRLNGGHVRGVGALPYRAARTPRKGLTASSRSSTPTRGRSRPAACCAGAVPTCAAA